MTAQAITNLRKQRSLTQGQVAQPLGMSTQAYQKYEAGERKFTETRLAAIIAALGVAPDAVDTEVGRIRGEPPPRPLAAGLQENDRDFVFDIHTRPRIGPDGVSLVDAGEVVRRLDLGQVIGVNCGALEVPGDMLSPWAESGETLIYDRDRYPKPGMGCVVETTAKTFHPLIYKGSDGSSVFARQLQPAATHTFLLKHVAGIYAVRMRGG